MIPRDPRSIAAFAHDVAVAALAWCAAFWLRFNLEVTAPFDDVMLETLAWVVPLQAVVFIGLSLYRGMWRYASLTDLRRIFAAAALSALAVAMIVTLAQIHNVPRSVLLLDPLLLVMMMGGSRLAYRAYRERGGRLLANGARVPVLVLGAGDAAADLVKGLARSPHWRVVAMLDDNAAKHGRQIEGVTVLGPLESLKTHSQRLGVRHAVIAMPGVGHSVRWRAHTLCTEAGIKVLTVPSYDDIVSGRITVSELRAVELDDLLGRDPVALDNAGLHKLIEGRRVLVTGAGGSIGAELCRQIARFSPARLVLLDVSEYALYLLEQEFRDQGAGVDVRPLVGDARDERRVGEVFEAHAPDVVFHAAAYKHVPLMEDGNALEAVRNNVLSTAVVARAAKGAGAGTFVLVSTDKAVNPTNVMGATKRLAERVCQALQPGSRTRFITVRFGNVLGSTGSVIPRFREQIARGGPVTVTHPDITRYFMSIPEAAQLVLQAALMGKGGEIFVLDMGEPVRIADLARQLIRLSGFGEEDIRIEYVGLRPGEKLYEELLADSEHTLPTPHLKLRVARARAMEGDDRVLVEESLGWLATARGVTPDEVRAKLKEWIPEYTPAIHDRATFKQAEQPARQS